MASPLGARPLPGPLLFARLISRGRECTEHLLTVYQQKGKDQITSLGGDSSFLPNQSHVDTGSVYRSVHSVHSAGSGEASQDQAQEEERSSN